MKNNNARINDFLKACEGKGYPLAGNGQSQRTIRQEIKRDLSEGISRSIYIGGNCLIHLTLPLDKCKADYLPPDLAQDFVILTGQPSREDIETESEIIKGCVLLGASYKGGGILTTPCGRTFHIPLDKPVTAQEVYSAVIHTLSKELEIIPQILLTRIHPQPQ